MSCLRRGTIHRRLWFRCHIHLWLDREQVHRPYLPTAATYCRTTLPATQGPRQRAAAAVSAATASPPTASTSLRPQRPRTTALSQVALLALPVPKAATAAAHPEPRDTRPRAASSKHRRAQARTRFGHFAGMTRTCKFSTLAAREVTDLQSFFSLHVFTNQGKALVEFAFVFSFRQRHEDEDNNYA